MRRLHFLFCSFLLLLFASQAKAQSSFTQTFTSVQTGQTISIVGTAIKNHSLGWNVTPAPAACSVQIDGSGDGVAWGSGNIVASTTCTAIAGTSLIATPTATSFVRINVTALSAGSTLTVTWFGSAQTGSGSTGLATDTSGVLSTVAQLSVVDGNGNGSGSAPRAAGNGGVLYSDTIQLLFNGATWDRSVKCPTAVAISVAAAGTQQVVAPVAGQKVRICAMFLAVSTAGTLSFTEGTGATCGTGTTTIFGQATLPVSMSPIFDAGTSVLQTNVSGDGFCIVSGTAAVQGWAQVEQH